MFPVQMGVTIDILLGVKAQSSGVASLKAAALEHC